VTRSQQRSCSRPSWTGGDTNLETNTTQTPRGEHSAAARIAVVAVLAVVVIVVLYLGARGVAGLVAGGDSWDIEAGLPVEVTVEPGSSATSIYDTMQDAGVVRSSELQAAAKAAGVEDRLQAGTYSLTTDMDSTAVLRRLVEGGDVDSGSTFTVIEGWTIDRIIDELADATAYSRAEYRKALRDGMVTSPLQPDDTSDPITRWEGLLFPAKYPMTESATPAQILQMMADEMTRRFEDVDWSGIGELGIFVCDPQQARPADETSDRRNRHLRTRLQPRARAGTTPRDRFAVQHLPHRRTSTYAHRHGFHRKSCGCGQPGAI